jgi:hypothetical protein
MRVVRRVKRVRRVTVDVVATRVKGDVELED